MQRTQGFAMLALVIALGIGSAGILIAVQALVPPIADVTARLHTGLATIERATREAFQRHGAFPATLDELAATSGLAANGAWRVDPWGDGRDFDYRVLPDGPRLRSRGADRRLDTGDDVVRVVPVEDLLRARTNLRLRLIRAAYLDSVLTAMGARARVLTNGSRGSSRGDPKRLGARVPTGRSASTRSNPGHAGARASLAPGSAAALRDALHAYALAKRRWHSANHSEREDLTARMDAAATLVATAQTAAGWTMPAALTGAGGLMERLGLPDQAAVDGRGRPLELHPTLAVLATGSDGLFPSDDDS